MSPGSHRESAPLAEGALQARRLGVLGGTFDPPHEGHLFAARAAKSAFHLDHVLFVPAAQAPHKVDPACASGKERVAMLALLLADEPDFSIFGGELDRPGPSYTIDTLRELRERLDPKVELFLILGADNLADFPRWRSAEEIIALAQPVVVARSGGALEASASERLSSAALAGEARAFEIPIELEVVAVSGAPAPDIAEGLRFVKPGFPDMSAAGEVVFVGVIGEVEVVGSGGVLAGQRVDAANARPDVESEPELPDFVGGVPGELTDLAVGEPSLFCSAELVGGDLTVLMPAQLVSGAGKPRDPMQEPWIDTR